MERDLKRILKWTPKCTGSQPWSFVLPPSSSSSEVTSSILDQLESLEGGLSDYKIVPNKFKKFSPIQALISSRKDKSGLQEQSLVTYRQTSIHTSRQFRVFTWPLITSNFWNVSQNWSTHGKPSPEREKHENPADEGQSPSTRFSSYLINGTDGSRPQAAKITSESIGRHLWKH